MVSSGENFTILPSHLSELAALFWPGWIWWLPTAALTQRRSCSTNSHHLLQLLWEKVRVIFKLCLQITANIHIIPPPIPCEQNRHEFCSNPFHHHIFRRVALAWIPRFDNWTSSGRILIKSDIWVFSELFLRKLKFNWSRQEWRVF
jgi:hypothetical protein